MSARARGATGSVSDHSESGHLSAFKPEPLAEDHNSANMVEGDRGAMLTAIICSIGWMCVALLFFYKGYHLVVPCFLHLHSTTLWAHESPAAPCQRMHVPTQMFCDEMLQDISQASV